MTLIISDSQSQRSFLQRLLQRKRFRTGFGFVALTGSSESQGECTLLHTHSLIHSPTHSFTHSLIHPLTHSLTQGAISYVRGHLNSVLASKAPSVHEPF